MMSNRKRVKKKVLKITREMLTWGYTENETGSAFEKRVASYFGKEIGIQVRYGSPDKKEIIPKGIHIFRHPYGSQKAPDISIFILDDPLKIEKKTGWLPKDVISYELKRSKNGSVTWNSGFPVQNIIYILNTRTNTKIKLGLQGTTMVLGSALVSKVDENNVANYKKNSKTKLKKNPEFYGTFYVDHKRPMFKQIIGERDWLLHKDRKEREKAVLVFIEKRWD